MSRKADHVTPPVQGKNIWKFAGSDYATVGYIAIPQDWQGAYLTFKADGDRFYFAFSESVTGNASSSKEATSTVADNAVSEIGANNLVSLDDGAERPYDMALLDFHKVKTLIILSDTGAGSLEINRSSGPVAT